MITAHAVSFPASLTNKDKVGRGVLRNVDVADGEMKEVSCILLLLSFVSGYS